MVGKNNLKRKAREKYFEAEKGATRKLMLGPAQAFEAGFSAGWRECNRELKKKYESQFNIGGG